MTAPQAQTALKPRTPKQAAEDRAALDRAEGGQSLGNYPAIFLGFMERGIPEHAIDPRSNVLTYRAWLAKGRQVQKGEKGVRIVVFKRDKNGESFPGSASVFHISQTRDSGEPRPEPAEAPAPLALQPLNPEAVKIAPVAPIAAEPDPEPEPEAEQPLLIGLEPIAPAPGPCPHTQRQILPGMPCVACGEFVHGGGDS